MIFFQHNVLTDIHHEMFAMMSLVNIHHLIYIQNKRKRKKVSCEESSGFTLTFIYTEVLIIILYITSNTYLSYTWKCVTF